MWSRREDLIIYYVAKNSVAHKILCGQEERRRAHKIFLCSRRVELIKYYVVKKSGAHKILCGQEERSS
jgi:hypothetical protein